MYGPTTQCISKTILTILTNLCP